MHNLQNLTHNFIIETFTPILHTFYTHFTPIFTPIYTYFTHTFIMLFIHKKCYKQPFYNRFVPVL